MSSNQGPEALRAQTAARLRELAARIETGAVRVLELEEKEELSLCGSENEWEPYRTGGVTLTLRLFDAERRD